MVQNITGLYFKNRITENINPRILSPSKMNQHNYNKYVYINEKIKCFDLDKSIKIMAIHNS
jgi:hypothetical protein